MPATVTLTLVAEDDGLLPVFPASDVRELMLKLIGNDPVLRRLLAREKLRPYSVKPLHPLRGRKRVDEGSGMWYVMSGDVLELSFSVLDDCAAQVLVERANQLDTVIMRNITFSVVDCSAVVLSYEELLEQSLTRCFLLEFKTPTRLGKYMFPKLNRLCESLVKLWNAFAPREAKLRESEKKLILNVSATEVCEIPVELRTKEIILEIKGRKVKDFGFKGTVLCLTSSETVSKLLAPLLRLGEFSNVGKHRTYGMGVMVVSPMNRAGPFELPAIQ